LLVCLSSQRITPAGVPSWPLTFNQNLFAGGMRFTQAGADLFA
jgi:hypothetical protein